MISVNGYKQEDLLLIKGHLLTLAICIILIAGIFWTTNYLDKSAIAELEQAHSQMAAMRSSITKIQSEQDIANKYLNAYLDLQTSGVVGPEDRLQLLELLAQIRSRHELFPININIGEQAEYTLSDENNPDGSALPVNLRTSVLDLDFPLLHEEDFSRLMHDLLGSSHLLQPANCTIKSNNSADTNFYYLDKHFTATCAMYWYTFDVKGTDEAQP